MTRDRYLCAPMAEEESISLNKFIADTGLCSRREADRLIRAGRVSINRMPTRPGNRVFPGDDVRVDGRVIQTEVEPIYIVFNKPVGIVCTSDKREKDNIIDFIRHPERLFHIGRLDKPSEGLIFLTNDGDIVNKILRAGNKHEKEYIVTVDKAITEKFVKNMSTGVQILGTKTKPCYVEKLSPKVFKIILTQGLNRQIRRMCTHLGFEVVKLKRVRIMHIELGNLPIGDWRSFTAEEIKKMNALIGTSTNTPDFKKTNKPTEKKSSKSSRSDKVEKSYKPSGRRHSKSNASSKPRRTKKKR